MFSLCSDCSDHKLSTIEQNLGKNNLQKMGLNGICQGLAIADMKQGAKDTMEAAGGLSAGKWSTIRILVFPDFFSSYFTSIYKPLGYDRP